MPDFEITTPSGRRFVVTAPDGATQEEVLAFAQKYSPKSAQDERSEGGVLDAAGRAAKLLTPAGLASSLFSEQGRQDIGNAIAGGVRGAGSIGATLMAPVDMAKDAIAGKGLSLESNRHRRTDMDAALENMGAESGSVAYQGGKLATEVAGTLGAGGLIANGVRAVAPASKGAQVLATAIESGGFRTGGNVGRGADLAARTAGGAISGGAGAGLVNPEDAATGAMIGAAVPGAVKVAAAGFDGGAKLARHAASVVSPKAARSLAVDKVAATLGDDVAQAAADIGTYYPKGAESIPLSAAAITKDVRLAQLEQGSRLKDAAAWFEFDQKQGRAVFDNVLKATEEAGELGERLAKRQDNWRTMWATTSQNFKPRLWVARMTQFGADLQQATQSPDASNPAVRGVLDAINTEMDRVGPGFSPAHLQQLRANLNGKVQPLSPDVFKSAPRDSPAIKSLIKEMDDILNVSTGGKWQKVLETYAQDSDAVRAAKAAAKVRSSFIDEATGRVRGTTLDPSGDVPRITEAGLGRAMDAARMPDKSLALSDPAAQRLEATVDALRQQNVVQQLKKTATAGGGSDTIPNAIAAGASSAGAPNFLMQAIGAARKLGTAKTDREIAALLSSPDELAQALEGWLKPAQPTLQGSSVMSGARALPVGGAAMLGLDQSVQPPTAEGVQPAAPVSLPVPISQTDLAPSIANIGTASTVDDAIMAAAAAVEAPGPQPIVQEVAQAPEPEPVVTMAPPAPERLDASGAAMEQPFAIWTGRRGSGYLTPGDAQMALPTRQKVQPDLEWRIEQMENGVYRLAGYKPPEQAPQAQQATIEASPFRMNDSGTATIQGDPATLRQMLAQHGIISIPMRGGVLVGRSHAQAAMQLLQQAA